MGNKNFYKDHEFQQKYAKLQREFRAQEPLYDVDHITFPLSTKGMKIVDATGRRVKLAGGNWSGGHMSRHSVAGLDQRPLKDLCHDIRHKFDLNCVRLTFSLQMYYKANIVDSKLIKANPQLHGKNTMQIFDETIKALTDQGIMVYLNNHTSKSMWCCSNSDGQGLWWTKEYPQERFYGCLMSLADRYKGNERVIGIDLRNQIRKSNGLSPTWGDGNPKTDWKRAAEYIGNKIQNIAPHWLIIVGGIDYQLDLRGIAEHPVKLRIPNKLVYSGHFYSFSWGPNLIWSFFSQESFREKLFNDQLYVRGLDLGVPFLFGQFGNNIQDSGWIYFIRYLKQLDLDWTYWCLDGYKCDEKEDQTYGVWNYTFSDSRHPELLKDLKRIGRPVRGIKI